MSSNGFVYSVRHLTRFTYDEPVSERVMDVRLHPIKETTQRCHSFDLLVEPANHLADYVDHMGNRIHYFNIPGIHRTLTITAKSVVEVIPRCDLPLTLPATTWAELDSDIEHADFWEWLIPSHFTQPTEALLQLAAELNVTRRDDPLGLVREINSAMHGLFEYDQDITHVHSPLMML